MQIDFITISHFLIRSLNKIKFHYIRFYFKIESFNITPKKCPKVYRQGL
jgi:hypothetical protein